MDGEGHGTEVNGLGFSRVKKVVENEQECSGDPKCNSFTKEKGHYVPKLNMSRNGSFCVSLSLTKVLRPSLDHPAK